MPISPSIVASPPWKLTGNGYIFTFWFTKKWAKAFGHLHDFQLESAVGGFGTVMLVDYHSSDVGPYQELLIVPGRFKLNGKKQFSISKIYVSSYESVWNGINNWGIPKELADFEFTSLSENKERVKVSINGKTFFEVEVAKRDVYVPITTKFFPLRLAQKRGDNLLITNSSAKGKATFAKAENLTINQEQFPDISTLKPLISLAVKDFEMTFPVPEIF
ncbi:MAG: acetoacetate decarboxylase family protein [Spirosomaceae bacterium]|nr:acetoacetate decarboxylase family protein [Spirosomataceae bacterium]